jgi:hypothetical protein
VEKSAVNLLIKKKKTGLMSSLDSLAVRRWSLSFAKDIANPSPLYALLYSGKKWRMKKADRIYHANKNVQAAWCRLIGYNVFDMDDDLI